MPAGAVFIVLGPFSAWFGFTTLSWPVAAVIVGITVAYLVAAEAGKHLAQAASRRAALRRDWRLFGPGGRGFLRKIKAFARIPAP